MTSLLAFVLTLACATALYGASPHCLWSSVLRRHPRAARLAGGVLALAALLAWIDLLGGVAGTCAMLVNGMLALAAQPLLALLLTRQRRADPMERD